MDGINRYIEPNRLDGISIYSQPEALYVDGTNLMLADANLGGHNIKNLATATNSDEAVNFGQITTLDGNVVHKTGNETINGIKTFLSSPVIPNATLSNQPVAFNQLSAYPLDTVVVHKTGNLAESIDGVKTFSSSPVIPNATLSNQPVAFNQLSAYPLDNTVVHKTGNLTETINGTKIFDGLLSRNPSSYNSGEYVKSTFGSFLTQNYTLNGSQNYVQIGLKTITVKTTPAYLVVTVDVAYGLTGFAGDQIRSRLIASDTSGVSTIAVNIQNFNNASGGGTRSNTLFPLQGFHVTNDTSVQIALQISTLIFDDQFVFGLQIVNDGPAKNFYRVDEFKY